MHYCNNYNMAINIINYQLSLVINYFYNCQLLLKLSVIINYWLLLISNIIIINNQLLLLIIIIIINYQLLLLIINSLMTTYWAKAW